MPTDETLTNQVFQRGLESRLIQATEPGGVGPIPRFDRGKLEVVDVSDPVSPTLVYELDAWPEFSIRLRAIGDRLYALGTDSPALYLYDLSNPTRPRFLAIEGLGAPGRDVDVLGELIYVATDGGGLQIFRAHEPPSNCDLFLPLVRR